MPLESGHEVGFESMGHLSVQYTDARTGAVQQAWHDPILGEGTDIEDVKRASKLRVLLLGAVAGRLMDHEVAREREAPAWSASINAMTAQTAQDVDLGEVAAMRL